jgi:hypothetical protein
MEANGVLEAIYRKAYELGLHTEVDERKFKITLKAPEIKEVENLDEEEEVHRI